MKVGRWAAVFVALAAGVALMFAPVLFTEAGFALAPMHVQTVPSAPPGFDPKPGPALGTVVDGHWRVQSLGQGVWAIGEPQDDLDNYEYLIVGASRALLIDAGATSRDLKPVLATLTTLPVTVIPTHLHYDHTNGIANFTSVAMIDLPQTRARVKNGVFRAGRYQYLRDTPPSSFKVTQWIKPDAWIDLGGRRVQVLSTPGHTATSASIWDPTDKRLFTGDYIYTTSLYAFAPGASLSAYERTADRLLKTMPDDTTIYGAHCCRNDVVGQAPWLTMNDLRDLRRAVHAIRDGKARGHGFPLHRFPVNARMTLLTLYPFGDW